MSKQGNENSDSTFNSLLGARISQIADILGGKKKLAIALGTYEVNIYRYIRGENAITAKMLVNLANLGNVNLEWLAIGEGPMKRDNSTLRSALVSENPPSLPVKQKIDESLLYEVLLAIEEGLSAGKKALLPGEKAKLIATIYKMQPALPIERSAIFQIIEMIEKDLRN